jgi:hypothetical protein
MINLGFTPKIKMGVTCVTLHSVCPSQMDLG